MHRTVPRLADSTAAAAAAAGLAVALLSDADVQAQCAMCRTVLNSPEGQQMIAALRSGILLLLAAPVAIFATVAVLAVRRQRRRTAPDGASHE